MALPKSSTSSGYMRPQQKGGSAGVHRSQMDAKRGLAPGPGKGGTAGDSAKSVDMKTGQDCVTSTKRIG